MDKILSTATANTELWGGKEIRDYLRGLGGGKEKIAQTQIKTLRLPVPALAMPVQVSADQLPN